MAGAHWQIKGEGDLTDRRASLRGREELVERIQQALALTTKKEAQMIAETMVAALEAPLLSNLGMDGFTLKLGSFGNFYVRRKPSIRRMIGFSGQTILTKYRRTVRFVSLGSLKLQQRAVLI
jgi:nucleoid DNA-binding protein